MATEVAPIPSPWLGPSHHFEPISISGEETWCIPTGPMAWRDAYSCVPTAMESYARTIYEGVEYTKELSYRISPGPLWIKSISAGDGVSGAHIVDQCTACPMYAKYIFSLYVILGFRDTCSWRLTADLDPTNGCWNVRRIGVHWTTVGPMTSRHLKYKHRNPLILPFILQLRHRGVRSFKEAIPKVPIGLSKAVTERCYISPKQASQIGRHYAFKHRAERYIPDPPRLAADESYPSVIDTTIIPGSEMKARIQNVDGKRMRCCRLVMTCDALVTMSTGADDALHKGALDLWYEKGKDPWNLFAVR